MFYQDCLQTNLL